MTGLLLGIDIGTYSSKGVLVEPDGHILRSQVVEHTVSIPRPGWVEQDADDIWWGDCVSICHALLDGHPYSGEDVASVAVSAIGPCMLPLDRHGRPLRPGILYGVDVRANAQIDQLNEMIGAQEIFSFTGMALSSQAVGPKILWMKQNEPELFQQTGHITTASSYLIYRLTGEKVIDRHTASHFMPLMDGSLLEWSTTYGDYLIDPGLLPRLGWSDELAGQVNASGASQTGLKIGTPVAVGAVDALSEGISVGVVQPGDLMIMYGSTAFFILVQQNKTPDIRMWTVGGAYAGQFNLAAGMTTTGSLTRWFCDELSRDLPAEIAYNHLFSEAEHISPGSGGLLILPYFSGERTPINDPLARGMIAGLTLATRREHIFRAVLEGVAYGIRHNLDTFKSIGCDIRRIVAVGGGTKSRTWLQIVSDVAGIEQIVPSITIGASYGDAFLAGLAAGILKRNDIHEWVKDGSVIHPNYQTNQIYEPFYRNYLELYTRTHDIAHFLSTYSH
jgi:xylulokinase